MSRTNNILVDICWTLFYSNTTFDFLDFIIKDKSYFRLRKFFSSYCGKAINLLIYKVLHYDCQRTLALKYLKGYHRSEILACAERFYNEYLIPRRIDEVWNLLDKKEIILISGTIDIIAQTIASHLGAKMYYASQLDFKDNICTGKYCDFLLTKSNVLQHYKHFDIITDNLTDIGLIQQSQLATVVIYNNQERWDTLLKNITNTTFIYADQSRY